MTRQFDLEFCFKGKRNYVHGTDIYKELIALYEGDVKNIDLAFHGVAKKNMTFYQKKPENQDIKVVFRCLNNEKLVTLFGTENEIDIDCRYEYKEEKIVENSLVNTTEQSISLKKITEYSFIEHIVAMNKALVEKLYPEIIGKWYFTRLKLQESVDISDILSLKLVLKSNFQFKLTKSVIIVNGTELGEIYFSLVSKES